MTRRTVGGLGLTGLILTARLQLRRLAGTTLEAEDIRLQSLVDFFPMVEESAEEWEYTAAWFDCLAGGGALGRGIFSRARHRPGLAAPPPALAPRIVIPMHPLVSPLNRLTLRVFNAAYFHYRGRQRCRRWAGPYESVLYPLDAIGGWNRLYGRRGFFQFQCVLPTATAREATAELLARVATSGEGSLLAVLKTFGDKPSPGLLSFPMPGVTLALDFPDRGASTRQLLGNLERLTVAAGGRLYAAKDSLMSADTFRRSYPRLNEFLPHLDQAISSGFARRVELDRTLREGA